MQAKQPTIIKQTDGRLRPYVLSIDWLQVSVLLSEHFVADGTNCWGYTTERKATGSKVWKDIFIVYDNEGVEIGTLACHPHSDALNKMSGVLKYSNDLLYEADAVDRAFAAIKFLGLSYRGITRLDLAYDCNELFNGLQVESLVRGYLNGKYVKRGQNKWMLVGNSNYYAVPTESGDDVELYTRKPDYLKTKAEMQAERQQELRMFEDMQATSCKPLMQPALDKLTEVPKFLVGSLTWGFRSNAIQVQIYDKSRELREVKFKKHIWQTWEQSGLDTSKPVYRIEIRIQNEGKHVVNLQTNKAFVLSAVDIITQGQIEQLFFDYAEKYFCFHRVPENPDFRHKERFPRLQVLSLCNQPVTRPKRTAFKKDYTRSTKIALNQLNKEVVANAAQDNEITKVLREARDYLERTYELHKQQQRWMEEDLAAASLSDSRFKEISPEVYFELRLAGAPEKLCKEAALHEQLIESGVIAAASLRARMANNMRAVPFAEQVLFRLFDMPDIKELIHNELMYKDRASVSRLIPTPPPPTDPPTQH